MRITDTKTDAERFWALRPAADGAEKIVLLAVSHKVGTAMLRPTSTRRVPAD